MKQEILTLSELINSSYFTDDWKIITASLLFSLAILFFAIIFLGVLTGKKELIKGSFACQLMIVACGLALLSQWAIAISLVAGFIFFVRKSKVKEM